MFFYYNLITHYLACFEKPFQNIRRVVSRRAALVWEKHSLDCSLSGRQHHTCWPGSSTQTTLYPIIYVSLISKGSCSLHKSSKHLIGVVRFLHKRYVKENKYISINSSNSNKSVKFCLHCVVAELKWANTNSICYSHAHTSSNWSCVYWTGNKSNGITHYSVMWLF